jgi:hypothetical protein
MQLIPTVTPARSENVTGETLAVHSDKDGIFLVDLAFYESQMMSVVDDRSIEVKPELTVVCRQSDLLFFGD